MNKKTFNSYELYTREEMSKIAKEIGFLFVETSNDDYYEISKDDIVDFIILESERCGHSVDIKMYVPNPNIQAPILSTYGCFLNNINQNLRREIIDRLVKLQTTNEKPKRIKVFDNDIFSEMSLDELGENLGQTIQFDKFYKKYYMKQELEMEDDL